MEVHNQGFTRPHVFRAIFELFAIEWNPDLHTGQRHGPTRSRQAGACRTNNLLTEQFVSPEDLLANPRHSGHAPAKWFVIHTKPRAEKSLARRLHGLGLSYYLPVFERRYRVQRRQVCSQIPLFPGYLFLFGDDEARRNALATRLAVGNLRVDNQEQLATDLARIHGLIDSGTPLFPEERLCAGMRAEIRSGPLAGLEGTVLRKGKTLKFVIGVDFLQQGASIEVDASMIQPI